MSFSSSSYLPQRRRRSCDPLSHSATAAVALRHPLTLVSLLLTITFTPPSPFRNSNASTLSSSSSVYLPSASPLPLLFSWLLTPVALDPIPLAGTTSTPSGTPFPLNSSFNSNRITTHKKFLKSRNLRYVFAANAIVAVYSLFEMIASVWEISREVTLFPEILQVWFDFGHDQVETLILSFFFSFSVFSFLLSNRN